MIYRIDGKHLVGLIFILAVAVAIRFANLDSSEFWYDEATISILAQDLASGKSLPLLGIPSSAGVPNPPIGVYILAVPYFFSKDPLFAVGFIAFLNVIGVGLLWLIGHRYFSPTVGFIGGLMYAVSPWAVLYSRKIWGQDIHTPFILAGFLLGFYGFIEGKRWAQVLCLPVLVLAIQVHFAAWALLPAYLVLLWIGRKHISRGAVAISVLLAFLTLIPFIVGLTQIHFTTGGRTLRELTTLPFKHVLWLATGLGMGEVHALPDGTGFVSQYPLVSVIWLAAVPLMALGIWNVWQRSRGYALFLLAWGFAAPLLLVTGIFTSHQHYYVPSIPAYCLLIAEGVVWLAGKRIINFRLRELAIALVALIAITQAIHWRSFLNFVDKNYVDLPGTVNNAYSTPLHYFLDIRENLKDDVIAVAGTQYDVMQIHWSPLLEGEVECLREAVIADGGVAILPNHPFSLLRAPNATPYEFANLYQSAEQIVFPLREGEGSYTLDQIETPPQWVEPELLPISPIRFDNSIVLNGYRFSSGRIYLDWALSQQGTQDYKYFIHVLDDNGERIAQRDPSFYAGKYWCAGDRIVTWTEMELPPAAATLRIGMYRFEDANIIGSNTIDDAGNAAPWADIPLSSGD